MKRILAIGLAAGLSLTGDWARAAVEYSQTFNSGGSVGSVTAGNPVPTVFTGTFNADPNSDAVLAITVSLNVSGGYSGSFYLALTGPDGIATTILLSNPGTSTSGLNITLDGASLNTINSGSNLSSGTYAPYGSLSALNDQSADGTWTLAFADSASGTSPTLNSWTLNVLVPEPVNVALGVFGLLFGVVIVARHRANKLAASRVMS